MNHQNINNNNTPLRGNISFGNARGIPMQMQMPMQVPANPNQHQIPHLLSQSQSQGRPYFPGHFQTSEPQGLSFAQGQSPQPQVQAQVLTQHQANTNVHVSSPPATTPGPGTAGTGKRLHKPPSRMSGGSTGQGSGSPMKTMELAPAVHRGGKRKRPDKVIPEQVAAILPESALYTQLLEYESRMDAALARKKTDIVESLRSPMRAQKVLRIYVFNTFANQTETNPENENVEPPSWSLKLMGRFLENSRDPGSEGVQQSSSSYLKFSSFFKKITIYLDQNLYPDNHVILWDSSRSPVLHEGFEVKRKGNKEFTVIIRLEMNYEPEKFKLSPALQDLIGLELETRPRILTALWQYVKMQKLQIPGDTSSFICNPPLRKLFGEEKLKFSMVPQKLNPHLTPPGPIHLEHKIKLSGASPAGNTCYDVLVDVPLTVEKELSNFLANLEKNEAIDAYDEIISSSLKKIDEHRKRRAFFLGFSQSPAEFINTIIASQARDLKRAAADSGRDIEKERLAEFYNQPWIEDAVTRYLNRRTAAGSEVAGNK